MIPLDKNSIYIIDRLAQNGFNAYAVGGAVRDGLLGRAICDIDIATDALPDEMHSVFEGERLVDTGIRHGTVTLVRDGTPYEITTFRTELGYSDSRHPDAVSFVKDIVTDLSRRDFTVNAMAYSPSEGLIDPFGGRDDLKKGILRTVGEPADRFSEDALRILRCIRFSSVYGFTAEQNTFDACYALRDTIKSISRERAYAELSKILTGDYSARILEEYYGVILGLLGEYSVPRTYSQLPKSPAMRFSALCGSRVGEVLLSLRADKNTCREASAYAHSRPIPKTLPQIKRFINEHGVPLAKQIAIYRNALFGEDGDGIVSRVADSGECLSVQQLDINGSDLQTLGIKGSDIKKTLDALLFAVFDGELANSKELLLKKAKYIDNDQKL